MASSPEYLAPSVQHTETLDIDIDPAILPNGSCSSIPPSTVSYSTPDPNSYSEVSHISSFDTSPVIDERLLTPVSSAASPQLQQRSCSSCRQSPFEHHHQQHPDESTTAQQPTPPHTTATMYPYPEYLGSVSQATPSSSSIPMPAIGGSESSHHEHLLPFLQHPSPSHHQHDDPPPQTNPYFGSYTVSVPQDHEQYYLPHAGDIGPLGLLRQDVHGSDSYTHRPLAPIAQQQQHMFGGGAPHHHPYHPRLPRLSPNQSRQYATPRARRDRTRKASARNSTNRRESFSPRSSEEAVAAMHLHHQQQQQHVVVEDEDDEPHQEVTLDDKTPAELRRLWDTRRKWLGKKGNGMWEDIMLDYLGEEYLSENKKTQVKAALQMKIHRMLLKHGKWPERDEAALLRAYKRWEENRYVEILRLYDQEMAGRKKAYEWKSQHIEAELVKMGLEEPERDRDSKARKRKQVAARHQARSGGGGGVGIGAATFPPRAPPRAAAAAAAQLQIHRLPGMYDSPSYAHYTPPPPLPPSSSSHYEHHRATSYDAAFAEQIGAQPPALSDEQNDQLAREILERNPFADNDEEDDDDADVNSNSNGNGNGNGGDNADMDVDIKMELSDYGSSEQQQQKIHQNRPRASSLIPGGSTMGSSAQHSATASPDLNAQRSAAVARQACGEMIKQQQYESGVDA